MLTLYCIFICKEIAESTVNVRFILHICYQVGIHGLCQSTYANVEDANSQELSVTQIVDINNCKKKAAIYRGMALAVDNKLSKEVCLSNP